MSSGIILYKSKYGATRKYAEWLSEKTYIIDSFCSFDEGVGGKVSCVKSVSGKRIYIFNLQI